MPSRSAHVPVRRLRRARADASWLLTLTALMLGGASRLGKLELRNQGCPENTTIRSLCPLVYLVLCLNWLESRNRFQQRFWRGESKSQTGNEKWRGEKATQRHSSCSVVRVRSRAERQHKYAIFFPLVKKRAIQRLYKITTSANITSQPDVSQLRLAAGPMFHCAPAEWLHPRGW